MTGEDTGIETAAAIAPACLRQCTLGIRAHRGTISPEWIKFLSLHLTSTSNQGQFHLLNNDTSGHRSGKRIAMLVSRRDPLLRQGIEYLHYREKNMSALVSSVRGRRRAIRSHVCQGRTWIAVDERCAVWRAPVSDSFFFQSVQHPL